MAKKTYLITGITGYIGSLIAKRIMESNEYRCGEVHIYAIARNVNKLQHMFQEEDYKHLTIIDTDICNKEDMCNKINQSIDYMIHCAATTQSVQMISNPVEIADGIVLGTRNILELAYQLEVKSMVYLSSMEVYGCVLDIGRARKENELGDICLDSTRSCYSLGKRMAEHYCYIYQKEYGVPVKIARLAQTFGKGVRVDDNRVYMQFARAVIGEKDIVLHTTGASIGNYCAAEDAVNAIFTILIDGVDGEVYNVSNEANTMSIKEMAELVATQVAEGRIQVKIELEEIEKKGYAPDTKLRLSNEKLCRLGWRPTKGLVEMYQDIVSDIRIKEVGTQ